MRKMLYSIALFLGLILLTPTYSNAQVGECPTNPTTKIMLVGDSWAHFMWSFKSMREALNQSGFADVWEDGNYTALISMQAETWASDGWIDLIKRRIKQMPDVEIFVIFIGGNDVVWKWRRDQPADILLPYADAMLGYTDAIIDTILSLRPKAQIVIGSYDYPNFAETMDGKDWNPYYSQWEKFGFAPPDMVDEALRYFEEYRMNYPRYKNSPNIHFINNIGVSHYYGGYPTPSIYPPYGTFPPKSVPLPFGDPRYPTHPNYMGLGGLDAFHFNETGYRFIAHNMIKNYIGSYFMQDMNYSFHSDGNKDGWVSDKGEVKQGGDGIVGKIDNDNYATLFTFNTDNFPENVSIEKGALFITRKDGKKIRADDNVRDEIIVEMAVDHFGSSSNIEAEDYYAPADFTTVGCLIGRPIDEDYKFRVDLSREVLDVLETAKRVQFRVSLKVGANPGNKRFFNTYTGSNKEDEYYTPTLSLKMSEVPDVQTGIINASVKQLTIYPNPASDIVNFDIPTEFAKSKVHVSITDMLGSVVKTQDISQRNLIRSNISIGDLPVGLYNLTMTDGENVRTANIIVQR
ncbi:MAG: T9SS type A sorting domain-containing protein [Chitinophagales bacterium]|nr:T9SS type A sorting domain-containing protein [Chitinophagales bacterium]